MEIVKSQAQHLQNVVVLEGNVSLMQQLDEKDPMLNGSVFDWPSFQRCIVEIVYLMSAAELNQHYICEVRFVNTSAKLPTLVATTTLACSCRILPVGTDRQTTLKEMLMLLKGIISKLKKLAEFARTSNSTVQEFFEKFDEAMSSLVQVKGELVMSQLLPKLEATKLFGCTSKLLCVARHCILRHVIDRDSAVGDRYRKHAKNSTKAGRQMKVVDSVRHFFEILNGTLIKPHEIQSESPICNIRVEFPYNDSSNSERSRDEELRQQGLPCSKTCLYQLRLNQLTKSWTLRLQLHVEISVDNLDSLSYAANQLGQSMPFQVSLVLHEATKRLEFVHENNSANPNQLLLQMLAKAMDKLLIGKIILERALDRVLNRMTQGSIDTLCKHLWHYWNQFEEFEYSPQFFTDPSSQSKGEGLNSLHKMPEDQV